MFKVVIPARFGSTRLPGKPLRMIAGKTMLERVYRQAVNAAIGEVLVATDDARISQAATAFGGRALMTDSDHPSGTDRLAQVATREGWDDSWIVINVQGDEPLLPPENIAQVAHLLAAAPDCVMATLMTPVTDWPDFLDPNVVKVVSAAGRALYFSRSPLPWHRQLASAGPQSLDPWSGAFRHLGIYAYRVSTLKALATLEPSLLERTERLEQLRVLEQGWSIAIANAAAVPGPGVDTEEDLARVTALIEASGVCGQAD